jgi:hypothetical protein
MWRCIMTSAEAAIPSRDPLISSATFYACFLFDVADTIDLSKLSSISGESTEPAPLLRTIPSPEAIQFSVPPIAANLPPLTLSGRTASVRVKIYDYGVISIRFSFPYVGAWAELVGLVAELRGDDRLVGAARRLLHDVLDDCTAALDEPHEALVEDYFVAVVERFDEPVEAAKLLGDFRTPLVKLMLAEPQALSADEEAESVRFHFSYFPDDLVVVQWDSAFIYDSRADAEVVLDLLEFANSQLVEFRTYDARLDAELDAIYSGDFPPLQRWQRNRRRDTEQRAAQLRYLLVDIRELADRASNALKITGDAYYARIYRAIAARLGLDVWQRQIESKLDSVGDVYRYLVDQEQVARGEFLELIVIVLIAIEIVVGVVGLRH